MRTFGRKPDKSTTRLVPCLIGAALLAACEPRDPGPADPVRGEPAGAPETPPQALDEPRLRLAQREASTRTHPALETVAAAVLPRSADPAERASLGPRRPATGARLVAHAKLQPVGEGAASGIVEFSLDAQGEMTVRARLTGLTPGEHGLHVHEIGDCSAPDGSAAGGHLAPENDRHGSPYSGHDEHHAGDLGNVVAAADGAVEDSIYDDELGAHGDHGVVGRAVIVHLGQDDLVTQPSGGSGDPVACGVVEATFEPEAHVN